MLKDEKSLKELIEGVINDEYYWTTKLYEYIKPFVEKKYVRNLKRKYGDSYKADLENRCLHKAIRYIGKFKGNTWRSFKVYNLKIIHSTLVDFVKKDIKAFHDNCTQFDSKDLENIAYTLENYNYIYDDFEELTEVEIKGGGYKNVQAEDPPENWTSILVESFNKGLTLANLIFSKLTERDINLLKSFVKHSNLMEYSKESNCSYEAAKQRKYRLKQKIDKIGEMIDFKSNTWHQEINTLLYTVFIKLSLLNNFMMDLDFWSL